MASTQGAKPIDRIVGDSRFSTLNVLSLLGQAGFEMKRGNPERAMLYAGAALVAVKYKKASFAIQGVLAADRFVGKFAGERPIESVVRGAS